MDYFDEEDGWTRVSYRRGRQQQRRARPQRAYPAPRRPFEDPRDDTRQYPRRYFTRDPQPASYDEEDLTRMDSRPDRPQQQRARQQPRRTDRRAHREDSYPRRDHQVTPTRRSYASVTRGNQQLRPYYDSRSDSSRRPGYRRAFGASAPPPPAPRFQRRQNWNRREYQTPPAGPSYNRRFNANYGYGWNNPRPYENQRSRNTGNRPPQDRVESQDPDFIFKVRIIHRLIKSAHHLKNISGTSPPPIISRTTQNLATFIKPASPNDATQTLLEGNAKNWEYTALLILRQHYEEAMANDLQDLSEFPSEEWEGPFQIATSWARRNLGRRLRSETLRETEALLREVLTTQPPPDDSRRTTAAQVSPQDLNAAPPQAAAQVVVAQAQVHTDTGPALPAPPMPSPPPPPRATTTSTSTMTDQRGEDNTYILLDGGDDPPPALLPPPLSPRPSPLLSSSLPSLPGPSSSSFSFRSQPLQEEAAQPKPQRRLRTRRGATSILDRVVQQMKTATTRAIATTSIAAASSSLTPPSVLRSSDTPVEDSDIQSLIEEEAGPSSSAGITPRPRPQQTRDSAATSRMVTRAAAGTQQDLLQLLSGQPATHTPTRRPTRHINTTNKLKEWGLCVRKKTLIIGDSNLSRFPPFQDQDVQVESYPGAMIHHAESLLRKATCSSRPETIILSFGLNNRKQKTRATTIKHLQRTLKVARNKFPEATVLVPVINFSSNLPPHDQLNLQVLNNYIRKNCDFIPELPTKDFATDNDKIHWSHHTAAKMFNHWCQQTN